MAKWFPHIGRTGVKPADTGLQNLRARFAHFLALLDANNQVLKIISDMEEKSQGDHIFDVNYIRSRLAEIEAAVSAIIERMIALGGDSYEGLRARYADMRSEIRSAVPRKPADPARRLHRPIRGTQPGARPQRREQERPAGRAQVQTGFSRAGRLCHHRVVLQAFRGRQ